MKYLQLGRLESVDLRAVWGNEARDLTPWLAHEDNLTLLGETIGLDLEPASIEQHVGPYRADILCKDTLTDSWVLVENQLEPTHHSHLGQLITYAAGLSAVTIVWIASRFSDEHRAALDWLNDVTPESINFFGIEVQLWRIGDSLAAPRFSIVSKPNTWTKSVVGERQRLPETLTPTQESKLQYWQGFKTYLTETHTALKTRSPRPHYALEVAIGRSGFWLEARVYFVYGQDAPLGVYLTINSPQSHAFFRLLHDQKDAIESEIGHPLTWRGPSDSQRCLISFGTDEFDPQERSEWPAQWAWLRTKLEAFQTAFGARIRALDVRNADLDDTSEDHAEQTAIDG